MRWILSLTAAASVGTLVCLGLADEKSFPTTPDNSPAKFPVKEESNGAAARLAVPEKNAGDEDLPSCNGPRPAAADTFAFMSTTPTLNVSGPTIASRTSAASTKGSTKPKPEAGPS